MALSSANRRQAKSGNVGTSTAGASPFPVSLDSPTTDGSTLLACFASTGAAIDPPANDPPWGIGVSVISTFYVFWRADVPAGETSWTFTPSFANACAWRVEEWTGVDQVTPVAGTATNSAAAQATVATGTAPDPGITDFVAVAIWDLFAGSGTGGFPAGRSYSAGFTETGYQANGTGSTIGDVALVTAESYPGATGTVSCTLTLDTSGGGGLTNMSEDAGIVLFRAAGLEVVPGPTVLAATGGAG